MPHRFFLHLLHLLHLLPAPLWVATLSAAAPSSWPEFRGPTGQGLAPAGASLPLRWGPATNVLWKSPIPGKGWSSPVTDGQTIYLTTAIAPGPDQDAPGEVDRSLRALAIDAASGRILWSTEVFSQSGAERFGVHSKNSHASPTPVLGNDRLFVHFGHQGTACLDLQGRVLWTNRDFRYNPVHGNGGSPLLLDDLLIFACDGPPDPEVVALDALSGFPRWRTPRQTHAQRKFSFSTPLLIETAGRQELLLPGSGNLFAYDPRSGRELWRFGWGEGYSVVPRPVFGHGLVFASSGYDRPVLFAVRPGGSGDVTASHLAWTYDGKGVPRNASFLLSGRELFTCDDKGVATCFDALTGSIHWQERILSDTSASPLLSGDKIYFTDESGTTVILAASSRFQILAENRLEERILASLAVIESDLLIRTAAHLYRISP